MRLHVSEAYTLEQTARVKKIVEEHNGSDFVFADTPTEKEEIWKVSTVSLIHMFYLDLWKESNVCLMLRTDQEGGILVHFCSSTRL